MNVFELLGIESGDAISVNNPWSDSGYRNMIPLSLSRNGISIRAIDCRYGDFVIYHLIVSYLHQMALKSNLKVFLTLSKNY